MSFSPLIKELIDALCCLPGVGPKSAQRMAFQLLERDREKALHLSDSLHRSMQDIGNCQRCRSFCETPTCTICQQTGRDDGLLCVVETPADVVAIEQTAVFRGYYFVLMGHLSPLDGIGPDDIGIPKLMTLVNEKAVKEMVLATSTTVEGEATAHYIANLMTAKNIATTRIAHGVPIGGELEYIDSNTLSRAFSGRVPLT